MSAAAGRTAAAAPGRSGLPILNGWYAVAVSEALAPGTLERLHYFGRELVAVHTPAVPEMRTEMRTVGVEHGRLAAYCPHLGAHLGHGGR
ncbi:MAG TPA: hypothetical protein PLW10_22195, partial [Myxococcota bacterium]|nr:hypothetical protein [Myxococcota bacterium]